MRTKFVGMHGKRESRETRQEHRIPRVLKRGRGKMAHPVGGLCPGGEGMSRSGGLSEVVRKGSDNGKI